MSEPIRAYCFPNGMMAVFDANGEQVPDYQGKTVDELPRLRADHPQCRVFEADWDGTQRDPIVRLGEIPLP